MRIVITRRYELGIRDGINIFIFALAGALSDRGHQVTVIATSVGDPERIARLFDLRPRISLISVEGGKDRPRFTYEGLSLGWLTRGRQAIRRLDPDLVINNGALPFASLCCSCNLAHDLGWATSRRRLEWLRTAYKRFAYGQADHIVAMGSEVRTGLASQLHIPAGRVRLIPPCVRPPVNPIAGFDEREDAILHSGTAAYKDPGATLRAFAALRIGPTRLYLEGESSPALTRQVMDLPASARRRVELVGELTGGQLRDLFGRVRIASFPTRYRVPTVSATVVEAIAHGTPIVGSKLVSADVLQDGHNGMACRTDGEFANAYRALLTDSERWAFASSEARLLAPRFSPDRVAESFLELAERGAE